MAMRLIFHRINTKHRVIFSRSDPFDYYTDEQIASRYRFTKSSIMQLVKLIHKDIEHQTKRSKSLSPLMQLLLALRFYATGSFEEVVGDIVKVHKSTVCRVLRRVTDALLKHLDKFVKFPTGDDLITIKEGFFNVHGLPGIVGCIDGTQIRIIGPSQNEEEYVNRKGFYSLNIQVICDHNCRFTNVVAKWPGSTHDSRILTNSKVYRDFEGVVQGILLGDSGYPSKSWLLTPYLNPLTRIQQQFNGAHKRTRVCVERAIGQLKRRFHCLHGELRLNPKYACRIVAVCVMLHNAAKDFNDTFACNFTDLPKDFDDVNIIYEGCNDGKRFRDSYAEKYFGDVKCKGEQLSCAKLKLKRMAEESWTIL